MYHITSIPKRKTTNRKSRHEADKKTKHSAVKAGHLQLMEIGPFFFVAQKSLVSIAFARFVLAFKPVMITDTMIGMYDLGRVMNDPFSRSSPRVFWASATMMIIVCPWSFASLTISIRTVLLFLSSPTVGPSRVRSWAKYLMVGILKNKSNFTRDLRDAHILRILPIQKNASLARP